MGKKILHQMRCLQSIVYISFYRSYAYKTIRRPDIPITKITGPQVSPRPGMLQLQNDLTKEIIAKIRATGPITVADYMREVLINPLSGYYMHRDVFGQEGDFITSPEISQIFGELVAIWVIIQWRKLGSPLPFQVVELGPGRGTLALDVMKVLAQFKLAGQFSMHLIEISPHLTKLQAQRLCFSTETLADDYSTYHQKGKTASGTPVYWHKRLEDVPSQFSIILAHEFFDALPIHKLNRIDNVWREVLIDVNDDSKHILPFRYVLSKSPTPISQLYKPIVGESRNSLEYSLESDRIVAMLADRFERDGGFGLIIDYGHFGNKVDTFRAFRKHQLHNPLMEPGTADLTADVDFRQMKRTAEQKGQVNCYGPTEQSSFLKKMQGDARLEQLLQKALTGDHVRIKNAYTMLTDPKQMGSRFKFFSIFPAVVKEHLEKYPLDGFH